MTDNYHVPVMLNEVIDGLNIIPDGIYVDCTFGGGGHSNGILKKLGPHGKLIVFDQDEDAIKNAPDDDRLIFISQNFRFLSRFLKLHKIEKINGLLADLGVSSHQFDKAERGFSTRFDAPLDMRMDIQQATTAASILNNYTEEKLHKIFEQYGEVTNSKTLAAKIVEVRKHQNISTINNFKDAMYDIVKGNPVKYFAQVFQALRIEVNEELQALEELLLQIPEVLASKGRVVIITFHSLEDRLVKNFFKYGAFDENNDSDLFGNRQKAPFKLITKKPITASDSELKINSRSRSAKVRIAEKV